MIAWAKINYSSPTKYGEILEQTLWYNSHITTQGKPIYYEKFSHSINKLTDIFNIDTRQFKT